MNSTGQIGDYIRDIARYKVILISEEALTPIEQKTKIPKLLFSCHSAIPSLPIRTIMTELDRMYNHFPPLDESFFDMTLQHWIKQGVLPFNIRVGEGKRPSLIQEVLLHICKNNQQLVWGVLGHRAETIFNKTFTGIVPPLSVHCCHPSAQKFGGKFVGSGFFKEINKCLENLEKEKVKWI